MKRRLIHRCGLRFTPLKGHSMEDLVGADIGHYRILEQIGRGGMSTVFKAYQVSLDREVAIKVLPPYFAHDPQFAKRFRREATAVARLRHPNILTVFDFGEQDDYTYIVMEYIGGGRTLNHLLVERGTLDLQIALLIVQQTASALDYAHQRGIIHRDIKPSNILVPRDDWFLLSDFGIAKVAGGGDLTKTGVGMGTPDYMSPEQGRGLPVDGRADVYSLGVMLYRMVVGQLPYQADTPMGVIIKHINDPLPLPREQNPNVPAGVEQVIIKAMTKNPANRFATPGEMARILKMAVDQARHGPADTVLDLPTTPPPDIPTAPPPDLPADREIAAPPAARGRGVPRWAWLAGSGILVVVAIVVCLATVGLGGLAFLGPQDTPTVTQVVQAPTATQPLPQPTDTPRPSPVVPTATVAPDTPVPTPTATPEPVATATPVSAATPTGLPAATDTPGPTNTPKPTNTPPVPILTGKIAFPVLSGDSYDTWIVNADGSDPHRVATRMRQPCFRPDGVQLAVNGEAPNEAHLIIMNADGSNHRPASQHVEDSHPSWSPDGRRLVFDTTAAPGGGWQICIIDDPLARSWHAVPGPGVTNLRGKYPTWMPDHRIIFNTSNYWADDTAGGLYAIGDSGGMPARITSSGQDTAPAVRGGTVAFMSIREPGDYEIFTSSIHGLDAGLKQLTDNSAQDGLPAWSPNGKYIAFVSDEGGSWGLWVMNADGSGRRKLLDLPGTLGGDWGSERISWAP